jgi:L-serine/L-threonine ammonia-lyase
MSTTALMVEKLKTLGADVRQHGMHWSEADRFLREELLANDRDGVYVPPFDHPHIWEGNGTVIDELEVQMAERGGYDAVVCSVGGGGLFAGIMEALERHGRLSGRSREIKVMAIETQGAESLSYSLQKKELSRLSAITSIATSLGATQVARKAFEWAQRPQVTSCVFSDAEAAMASVCFADDERILVEAACGVSIATAYNNALSSVLYPDLTVSEFANLNIVLVVCGGSNVTLQLLESYRQKYSTDESVVANFHARRLEAENIKNTVNRT